MKKKIEELRILLVDDEELILENMVELLGFEGLTCMTASNGKQALEIMNSPDTTIDIVISDVRMPNGDGIELLKKIREQSKDMPIVCMVSGQIDDDGSRLTKDLLDLGANNFYPKPIDIDALIKYIIDNCCC